MSVPQDEPAFEDAPAPRPVPGAPTGRTWVLWGLWRAALLGISLAGVVVSDDWTRWVWLFLFASVALTSWAFRPGRTPGVRVPAALREPGDHRVVLQLPGEKPVHVVAALRRITGADLVTAKTMLESAPVVVAENLSQDSAAQAAHLLTSAGARATVSQIDRPGGPAGGPLDDPMDTTP